MDEKEKKINEAGGPVPEGVREAAESLNERLDKTPDQAITEISAEAGRQVQVFADESQRLRRDVEAGAGASLDAEANDGLAGVTKAVEGSAVKLNSEIKKAGQERKEQEEAVSTQVFEYKDKEGRLLGRASLTIERDARVIRLGDRRVRLDRVKGMKLQGEKGEVDLLAMTGVEGVDVLVKASDEAERVPDQCSPLKGGGMVVMLNSIPDSPLRLATMMHEMGHARQANEPCYRDIFPQYDSARSQKFGSFDWPKTRSVIEKLQLGFPEASRLITPEAMAELDREADAWSEAVKEDERLYKEYDRLKNSGADEAELGPVRTAWLAAREIKKGFDDRLDPIMHRAREVAFFVVKALENDATLRAESWMKMAKETSGVDLFVEVKADQSDSDKWAEASHCVADEGNITNVSEQQRRALHSYGVPTKPSG